MLLTRAGGGGAANLNLKEILWGPIDFLKGLMTGVWHGLHHGQQMRKGP